MIAGAGKPVVVTVNVPGVPTTNVVELALVIAGAWFTVSVNACGALAPAVLVAVNVIAYVPPVPAAGVPLSVPVPLPLSANVTPAGSATPPIASVGSGKPLVVTVNVPARADRERRGRRARDGRRLVDDQREGLRAVRQHAVRRGEGEGIRAARRRARRAAQRAACRCRCPGTSRPPAATR